jgi:hypothetical protein
MKGLRFGSHHRSLTAADATSLNGVARALNVHAGSQP